MRSIASVAWRFALALSVVAAVGCHDLNSVVPDPAEAGEQVTIFGGGFGASQGTSVVRYDGQELAVVSWTDTAIVATLPPPAALPDGTYALEVTVKNDTQAIAHTIGLPPVGTPDINSVSPDPAEAGEDVTIYGSGFGAFQHASQVLYDGEELAIVSWSDRMIVATLPASKADGIYPLDVIVGSYDEAIGHTIGRTAGAPDINNVVPDPAEAGTDISIAGGGFGATQGGSQVLYDGEELPIVSWSDTVIVATVPGSKASGVYLLDVIVGGGAQSIFHETVSGPAYGMVLVPEGPFAMGSESGLPNAAPIHTVDLDAFYIDATEVTADAYQRCLDDGGCTAPPAYGGCNLGVAGREDHPANCVTWFQAEAYCAWAGKRLPTEAEWEKAARGTDQRTYPWGETTASCDYAVMYDPLTGQNGCGYGGTAPVGSRPLGDSPYGASDMAGNVIEWVADWYSDTYYAESPLVNPEGPPTGTRRVLRGGDFYGQPSYVRASRRGASEPSSDGIAQFGFRCALDG